MQNSTFFRQFKRAFAIGLAMGVSLFLLPLLMLPGQENGALDLLPPDPTPVLTPAPTPAPGKWDSAQMLDVLLDDGTVAEMTMADYLWRVVAAEMPATFEPEALKAQAVCARTYTLWKMEGGKHQEVGADICGDSSCCQAYIGPAEAADKWGAQTEDYTAKIAQAVAETDGQVLTYEGKLIQAVFFSSSTDSTEDAAAVWGNSLPYLVSVESPEGEEVPNYRSTVTLTSAQMQELAKTVGATLPKDPSQWLTGISYTASGRVAQLVFGGITLSGGAARSLFGLRSTCFAVEEQDGTFTFSVTGYGHGVGMSQYGANSMAKEGATWQDIVSHYYTGVSIDAASP